MELLEIEELLELLALELLGLEDELDDDRLLLELLTLDEELD